MPRRSQRERARAARGEAARSLTKAPFNGCSQKIIRGTGTGNRYRCRYRWSHAHWATCSQEGTPTQQRCCACSQLAFLHVNNNSPDAESLRQRRPYVVVRTVNTSEFTRSGYLRACSSRCVRVKLESCVFLACISVARGLSAGLRPGRRPPRRRERGPGADERGSRKTLAQRVPALISLHDTTTQLAHTH